MTEATKELTSVRDHRHNVRNLLSVVSGALDNAAGVLRGVQGLTQEQQVERFEQANTAVTEATDAVGPVVAAIEGGKDLAATRDFAAWQSAKAARQPTYTPGRPEQHEDETYGGTTY